MKIHYISNHAVLEYDEVQMLLDMGHEVFANGAYQDPAGHHSLPRPPLKGAKYYSKFAKLAAENPRTDLPMELIEPFDVIIVMHNPDTVDQNWQKLRGKNVIWRSIGQSVPRIERMLTPLRNDGLKIVRYSPKEKNITDFAGQDAIIRFVKDETVFSGWSGKSTSGVVNFTQTLKGRRDFCHYNSIMPLVKEFGGRVYGTGNEDLGEYNGGQVPFEMQLQIMRKSRVMVYGGTWPAPYTLSFIEALMMGLPIVAVSKEIAHVKKFEPIDFYEVDEILSKIHGPVCDDINQMKIETRKLIEDDSHAMEISKRQRALAIKMFGRDNIAKQWKALLDGLD